MQKLQQNQAGFRLGDKVRLRSGPHKGARGSIAAESDGRFEIELGSGDRIAALPEEITNYSLAARRAWEAMPKRTGRPKGQKPVKRMVSMRLDSDVWDMLHEAAERELIPNCEKAVNDWVRDQVMTLLSQGQ
jgi:hypothetical protein